MINGDLLVITGGANRGHWSAHCMSSFTDSLYRSLYRFVDLRIVTGR
jgi:hypothetical protein